MTLSTASSGRSSRSASRTRHSTFVSPSLATWRFAASTIPSAKSLTMTWPSLPTRPAAANPATPVPAARSRIVCPRSGNDSLEHEVRHGPRDLLDVRVAAVPAGSHRLPHRLAPPSKLGRVHPRAGTLTGEVWY